ncbi:hypothetical protein IFR05_007308 [Cadophora sp. M221]|nr:hypothetical protein IFR05_007308 [Cadophora sp. M221]
MSQPIPTRFIVCVDGTWFTPDGARSQEYHNNTNIYRLWASIKQGEVKDHSGQKFNQVKHYEAGIGSRDDIPTFERFQTGIFGAESIKQIMRIYEICCTRTSSPQDEVWLYGFSRGAYVVRAVAGLLHHMRALTSAGTKAFTEDYSKALRVYEVMQKLAQKRNTTLGPGQVHHFLEARSRPAPRIQFLGAFDTVKAVNDRCLYDITYNDSILNLRHALALNEDRKDFTPESMYPEFNQDKLLKRSFLQMWFLGAHIDIGGSAENDGLALYPLQWMLLESEAKGLVLEFDGSLAESAPIDNPLQVVFPTRKIRRKATHQWKCRAGNGVVVKIQDLRKVHDLPAYEQRYQIRINRHKAVYWKRSARTPFNGEGGLKGYCEHSPQGTVLHPSVYLLSLQDYCNFSLDQKHISYRKEIEALRPKMFCNEEELNLENWNLWGKLLQNLGLKKIKASEGSE